MPTYRDLSASVHRDSSLAMCLLRIRIDFRKAWRQSMFGFA